MDKITSDVRHKQWLDIIHACNAGGLTRKAWCEQNGIRIKTFYYWQRQLRREVRLKKRQTLVRPLVEDYFAWLKGFHSRIPSRTKTGNGFEYCLKQEPYLRFFLEDSEVPTDNNAAEQVIRPFCVGKKDWLMIDTIDGAKSSAIIYSIAETAKANNLNPFRYFELLLTEIPRHMEDTDRSFLEKLEPWSQDLPTECRKQLD